MRHDLASAVPEQERDGHGSDGLYSGIEERVEEGGAELGPAQVRIEPAEELGFPALSRQELYHRHALEGLLKERIESREPRPHRAIAVAGLDSWRRLLQTQGPRQLSRGADAARETQ